MRSITTRTSTRSATLWRVATAVVAIGIAILTVRAVVEYPGDRLVAVTFVIAFTAMLGLVVPRPRSYGYTFLAIFLFLGFCLKTIVYFALGIPLVEPTGSFLGTGHAWDAALTPAIAGALGVIAARTAHLVISARLKRVELITPRVPSWYTRNRLLTLGASAFALVALHALNMYAALYQIGIVTRLVFPFHLNAALSWLLEGGVALWAATLVGWEMGLSPDRRGRALLIPLVEALASVTTISRAAYVYRILPYIAVTIERPPLTWRSLARTWRAFYIVVIPLGFAVSLAAVSSLRLALYPSSPSETPPVAQATTPSVAIPRVTQDARTSRVLHEISTLVVGRWIGIEGTMTVSAQPGLGPPLLQSAFGERATAGESSIYQRMAGSFYQTSSRYIFLTTPGPIAILDFSGSLGVVLVGMALLTVLLIAVELLASTLIPNAFVASVIGVLAANAIAQVQFPYILGLTILEMIATILVLAFISRIGGEARLPSA